MEALVGWLLELLTFEFISTKDDNEACTSSESEVERCETSSSDSKNTSISNNNSISNSDNDNHINCNDVEGRSELTSYLSSSCTSESKELLTPSANLRHNSRNDNKTTEEQQEEEHYYQEKEKEKQCEIKHQIELLKGKTLISTPPSTLPYSPSWHSNDENQNTKNTTSKKNCWAQEYSFEDKENYLINVLEEYEPYNQLFCRGKEQEEFVHEKRAEVFNIHENEAKHVEQQIVEQGANNNNENNLYTSIIKDHQVPTRKEVSAENSVNNNNNNNNDNDNNNNKCRSNNIKSFWQINSVSKTKVVVSNTCNKSNGENNVATSLKSHSSISCRSNHTYYEHSESKEQTSSSPYLNNEAINYKITQKEEFEQENQSECVLHGQNANMALISWTLTGPENFEPRTSLCNVGYPNKTWNYKEEVINAYLEEVEPPPVEVEFMESLFDDSESGDNDNVSNNNNEEFETYPDVNNNNKKNNNIFNEKINSHINKDNYQATTAVSLTTPVIVKQAYFDTKFGNVESEKRDNMYKSIFPKEKFNFESWNETNNKDNNINCNEQLLNQEVQHNNNSFNNIYNCNYKSINELEKDLVEKACTSYQVNMPLSSDERNMQKHQNCEFELLKRWSEANNNNNNIIKHREENLMLPIITSLDGLKKRFYGETVGTAVASVHHVRGINILDLADYKDKNKYAQQIYEYEEEEEEERENEEHYEKQREWRHKQNKINFLTTASSDLYSTYSTESRNVIELEENSQKESHLHLSKDVLTKKKEFAELKLSIS